MICHRIVEAGAFWSLADNTPAVAGGKKNKHDDMKIKQGWFQQNGDAQHSILYLCFTARQSFGKAVQTSRIEDFQCLASLPGLRWAALGHPSNHPFHEATNMWQLHHSFHSWLEWNTFTSHIDPTLHQKCCEGCKTKQGYQS